MFCSFFFLLVLFYTASYSHMHTHTQKNVLYLLLCSDLRWSNSVDKPG